LSSYAIDAAAAATAWGVARRPLARRPLAR
jgi:hypothetical protein